jgi:DNA-directed RNA polymerase beta' subunit
VLSSSIDRTKDPIHKCLEEVGISDEMNLHVPQSIEAEVEIMVSSRCALHIVSAQRNAPVNGIVQDGLVASYMLTNEWEDKNDPITMIDKDTVMKIYKDAEIPEHRIKDLMVRGKLFYPEYIVDGQFTDNIPGSLFVSILFPPNFCYSRTTETHPSKPDVIVEDGILTPKSGPLCVKSIGGKNGSIVHFLWKISPEVALYFISDLQQITDRWLPTHGFSMGIRDCFASNEKDVAKILIETRMKVDEVIKKGETTPDRLEVEINSELNSAMAVGPKLAKNSMDKGDRNALNIMRNSGAKGSVINLAQIAAFVGQQNIKGKRMPMQLSHNSRCLPSFLPGDLSPEARGFVEHNYLRGLTPQEAFFHAGAGRDGVIATALKSVTGDTPIVIIDHTGNSKYVLIGDWIDEQLLKNADKVEHHAEREMELLNVEELNMSIPTMNEHGIVTWGSIKNITRHDPGKELYEIKTLGGRQVIVTESKSLLIWDEDLEEFHEKLTPKVKIGDYVPVTMNLATPPIVTRYIDVSRYLPKTEYVYGTDFVLAEAEMEMAMVGRIRIPAGWWQKNNGKTFTLPYTKKSSLTRTCSGRSNTANIKEGCVYPYSAMRGEMMIPDKLELNEENGIFIGLFLAEGNVDIKSGYVQITNMNKNIQSFVKSWFDKLSIKYIMRVRVTDLGTSEDVRGYSTILAKLLTELVGHGARNKYVPDEAFTAPKEFIKGLLNGYFSGDGYISNSSVEVGSVSKRLIIGINILLSRLKIFGKVSITQQKSNNLGTIDIAAMNNLSIRGQWASIFADKIGLVDDKKYIKLQKLKPTDKHRNFSEHNDVVLDKIVEISKVDVKLHPKVYDLTIPITFNFGVANGLNLFDTAETGYMQKKIARKVEDFKIWIDGTVRDANGRVISFMYGDDGMDPKKLVSVKGMNVPYFVNPHFLAKQLNSDAKRSGEVTQRDEPRILKQTEIELLLSIVCFSKIKSTVIENVNENNRKILAKIIEDVKLYDCKIADFFVSIKDIYNNSKASYGLPVGLIAASSLGEPATQMVLNSFDYKDEIMVEENGMPKSIKMGKFIDDLMEKYSSDIEVQQDGTDYLRIDDKHKINHLSVDEDGNVMWKKLEAVTRHPPRNKDGTNTLLKVKTWSGRKVHATKAKSFLVRENNKIVGKTGEDLLVGDRLPIYTKLPIQESKILYEIDMELYFPKTDYIWGSEMDKARKIRDDVIKSGKRLWFANNNGTVFTIPYNRSDTAGIALGDKVRVRKNKACLTKQEHKTGSIYPKTCTKVVSTFPEKLVLDNLSGFFFGAYLAEGLSTKNYVCISNNDPAFRQRIYDFCDRYTIGHHTVVQENKIQEGWTSTDIRIHSVLLSRFMLVTCKTGSKEKVVPDWVLFANEDFLKGLIDGYFSGDGCVTLKKSVMATSISKKMLVGIQNILVRFGIFSKISKPKKITSNNRGSENINQTYNIEIQCENNKRFAETFNLIISSKQDRLNEIKKHNYRYTHSKDDIIPGVNLPTYANECHRDELPADYKTGDLFFDKVMSIEEYIPTTSYAYDLTVEDTRNLTLYNGLCAADTFHLAGIKSKDASSGVPRYKELNNATKTKDQKKPSCEIWFNDLSIQENAKIIRQLENEDKVSQSTKNAEKITKLKQETLEYVQLLRNKFEETYIDDFLIDYEMKYLPETVSSDTGVSPTGLITYEEYSEDWWVTLSKNMGKVDIERNVESWVICLYFDVEKLYRHRIDLEDISMAIEEYSGGDFMCIISPAVIGRIEVYTSLSELKSRACVKLCIEENSNEEGEEDLNEDIHHPQSLITENNIEYYICRDVAINFIKRTQISGIKGITKIYPREDTATHEYIVDTDGINFLEVLTSPNVDSMRTVCDDMHTIRSVLGIEATRTFLFKEVKRVISFDGTYVNPRHISMLVDAMTVNGCLDAASRDGISRDVGPNAKIMFEKNIDNAAIASVFTEKDTMASLSSSVMYGKLASIGSGAVFIANKEKI